MSQGSYQHDTVRTDVYSLSPAIALVTMALRCFGTIRKASGLYRSLLQESLEEPLLYIFLGDLTCCNSSKVGNMCNIKSGRGSRRLQYICGEMFFKFLLSMSVTDNGVIIL